MADEDTRKKFQEYLRKYHKDDKLVIEKIETKKGSNFGDNYMSTLIRIKLIGKRGNGKR